MPNHSYNRDSPIIQQYQAATVIGLGVTGYSAVRYLRDCGLQVSVMDSRDNPPMLEKLQQEYPEVLLYCGAFNFKNLASSSLLVVSPGVALSEPVLQKAAREGAHIVGDIELFLQQNSKSVIAITGSNGKSTVTALVGEMCAAAGVKTLVAGNIGLPVLDALTDRIDYELAVLELSSFQLETTHSIHAAAATVLNISADHMDRYHSMGDYMLAKARILRGAKRAILPRHDEELEQITTLAKKLTFGLDEPANDDEFGVKRQSNYRWLLKGEQRLIKLREISLLGTHNVKNILAAYALVDFLDLPVDSLNSAVKAFKGLPHRMQTVLVKDQVTWVNDSKATNVGATSTALQSLEKNVVWIAGGQGKGADFKQLRDAIGKNIKMLVLIGQDSGLIETALSGVLPIQRVADMQQAVQLAGKSASSDSVVLLSPACASFDQYRNYAARGDDFIRYAKAWPGRVAA